MTDHRRRRFVHPLQRPSRRTMLRWTAGVAGAGAASMALGCCDRTSAGEGVRDLVVVGGGLSGLMTAYALSDYDVLVLEREQVAGGRICTTTHGDFTISMGAAYMGRPTLDMRLFFSELGVEPVPVPPPVDATAYQGTIYPDDYAAGVFGSRSALDDYAKMATALMALSESGIEEAIYAADVAALAKHADLDGITMQAWLDDRKVHELVQRYVEVENRGLFGVANRDFSFLYSVPELAYNFYEPGLEDVELPEGPVPDFHTYEQFTLPGTVDTWTFRRGMTEVVEAMVAKPGLTGRVETGASVTSVVVDEDRTVTVSYSKDGVDHEVRAYGAVLATPAPVTAQIVGSGFSADVMRVLRAIRYTTYTTLALFTNRRLFRNAWNIACLDTCFTTLNDAIRTQVERGYDGESVLGVALPPEHAGDRSRLDKTDQQLVDMALKDIERYLPGAGKQVSGHHVQRFPYAFPVFGPGTRDLLSTLHGDATTNGPLFLAGDYMVYPTLGGAAVSGDLAAAAVRAYANTL